MQIRPRRNRKSESIRRLVADTLVTTDDLVLPLFIKDGQEEKEEISTLKGHYRNNIDDVLKEIEESIRLGLHSFILFPVVEEKLKDTSASYGLHPNNFYNQAAKRIKSTFPDITLISDVAMDPYSSDGHDGLVRNGKIINDETLPILGGMAIGQAHAGFDVIGPSDMMDGRVGYIRDALDQAGFTDTSIMSYTAKYASQYYGPFRDALASAPKSGNKKTYQMNPANRREAMIEGELDTAEGADYLMVKPALHYLDIIREMRDSFDLPIVAYHVSGECAMLNHAVEAGWLDRQKGIEEVLTCIKRAGADIILTYFAKEYAEYFRGKK